MGIVTCYSISYWRNDCSGKQWTKKPMELLTTLTNIPKVELQKTRLWKTLSRIGEILLFVIFILASVGFMFLYILLSLITPAGG